MVKDKQGNEQAILPPPSCMGQRASEEAIEAEMRFLQSLANGDFLPRFLVAACEVKASDYCQRGSVTGEA